MNPQGIYTLVSYGKALQRQMETVANNLANIDTVGYKEDKPVFHSIFAQSFGTPSQSDEEVFAHAEHLPPYTGVGTNFVSIVDMGKNLSQGNLVLTGNQLDMALANSEGYFTVDTPQGERFTRAGNFHLNQDNQLVTAEGFAVTGKEGPLLIEGSDVQVTEDGSVVVDGQRIGGLKIVTFPFAERLRKMGNSLLAPVDIANNPRILEDVKLVQGSLESSNVEAIKEMSLMIQVSHAYTSMQRALTSSDEMNRGAITLAEM